MTARLGFRAASRISLQLHAALMQKFHNAPSHSFRML